MTKTRAGKYRTHQGVPTGDPSTRIPSGVTVRDVACPACGAAIGERCVSSTGTPMHIFHVSRRRMATRAANQGRDFASAAFVRTLTTARRAEIRAARGLTAEQAGAIFGLSDQMFSRMERGLRQTPDLHACAYGAWLRLWDPVTPADEGDG